MNQPDHEFPDESRTMRPHAGESIEDTRNWPGLILIGLGLALLGITLTAAGYGFGGWAVIGGLACAVCLLTGTALVVAEHRRVKAQR
ncbi:hypothetical protein [Nocardia caishijiensis]|uniref:Uncharacterized protein n=1 Tax=Nocardia caishijiensis TaxID=184756 RepID=A0ABQ6YMW7_9NOCA|nr:hypothetical protein FNL39_104327 [Nocardia caishijiensis]